MNYLDIKFFQAAATIIPTLFIAFAITSKGLEINTSVKGHIALFSDSSRKGISSAVLLSGFFAAAEIICLATLAADKPTRTAMFIVATSIAAMIWTICYQALVPALDADNGKWFPVFVAIIPLILLIALFLVIFSMLGGVIAGER